MSDRSGTQHRLALARLLEVMIDPARFSTDEETLASYLHNGSKNLLAVVCPRGAADLGQVLQIARVNGLSVYSPVPHGLNPPKPGVVVEYAYMSDILSVDTKNLLAEIEPGVTWEQLLGEIDGRGVRLALPASAKSPYVLESALEREVVLPAARFSNKQLATFHLLLADGREYRSGSDSLPNARAHWREDGGPNISRVFTGSRNSFGLPLKGFVYLYPEAEQRRVVVRGFSNRKQACALAARAARSEIGTEMIILSKSKAKDVLGGDPGLASWSLVTALEGPPKLVRYQEKRMDGFAAELKLKPAPGAAKVAGAFADALAKPWYSPEVSIGFYTNWSRVEELSAKVEAALKGGGRLAEMAIPVKRGASVYLQFDVLDPPATASAAVLKALPVLANSGAFFSNPTGSLATHIFRKQPAYYRLLKDMKGFLDPDDMLNTGQVVEV